MATVGRGAEQYTVRFPDGLRDRIRDAAAANNRSMNAEIVSALEFWLEWQERPIPPLPTETNHELPVDDLSSKDIYDIVREAVREALAMYAKPSLSGDDD